MSPFLFPVIEKCAKKIFTIIYIGNIPIYIESLAGSHPICKNKYIEVSFYLNVINDSLIEISHQ